MYGRKAWILQAPYAYDSSFDTIPGLEMMATLAQNEGGRHRAVKRCVQEPGDVVVLPKRWGHLVVNLKPSVGIAKEFRWRLRDAKQGRYLTS